MWYHYIPTRMAKIKNALASISKDTEQLEILTYSWWVGRMVKTLWITVWQFLKNYIWPSYFTARYLPKGNESIYLHKDLYTNLHSNLFIAAKNRTQSICPSIDVPVNKLWYIHAVTTQHEKIDVCNSLDKTPNK